MQAGERIGARYVLEQRLGLGGMGEVWLAELEGAGAFRRRVVLKVLAPERRGDPRIAAMLADEARVVGALHHPGIVAALDYLETEEHGPVFVGCGPALREVIEQATADDPRDRFASASEMAAALLHACPSPSDPDRALAEWLHGYARDALVQTRGAASVVPRSDPPPAGKPVGNDVHVRRVEAAGPLFAGMPAPRRRALKIAAICGALLFLLLPVAFFAAPRRAHRFLQSAISAAPAAAHGDIRVSASPGEAEVYLDGKFRGLTPLLVEVPSGNHSVRVGSVKLGRWRAIDVAVKDGVEHRLDVDLSR